MFLHVTFVRYLKDYKLKLTFNNGAEGVVDLQDELHGEVFEPLKDERLFRQVHLTSRTIEWPNGADFAPEFLYEHATITKPPHRAPGSDEQAILQAAVLREPRPEYNSELSGDS